MELLVDAKEKGLKVVSAVVKRMLDKNVFLFGCLEINEGSATETVNQLTELQNARIQVLYNKYGHHITFILYFSLFKHDCLFCTSSYSVPAFLLTNRLFANSRIEHVLHMDLVSNKVPYEMH